MIRSFALTRIRNPAAGIRRIGLAVAGLAFAAHAMAPLYPTSRFLVPGMLEKGDYDLGVAWSGASSWDQSRFQLAGGYAIWDRLDLGVRLVPSLGDPAVALAAEAGFAAFRPGNWTIGTVFGGSVSFGKVRTFHYQHGTVHHGMQGASLDVTAAWKWLYFGKGGLYLRDIREYMPNPPGVYDFAGRYPEYDLFTVRDFLGVRFGSEFRFNFEIALMDDGVYNLWFEPSEPFASSPFTFGFAITWSPSRSGGIPESGTSKPHAGPVAPETRPDTGVASPGRSPFDSDQYWRSVKFGAIASGLGLVAGIAAGSMVDDEENYFFPPEMIYGMTGAVLAIPVGNVWGVYSDPKYRRQTRSPMWTLAGTAAGFGASLLLAPVTGGLSFYFVAPLGTVMGFRYGLGN